MSSPSVLQQELASRVLARRRLIPFIQRINPQYLVGWVHQDICERLERFSADVAAKKSPRLMLLMPPRHGKSEIASRNFPAWHMGQYPDHEIISCSYNVSLAMGFSRKVKQIIEDTSYTQVFPKARLDPKNQSTEEWALEGARGGYVAAGIGGPITGKGAHCVIPYSAINTCHGIIPASKLRVGDLIYGYDHFTGKVVETRVVALSVSARNAEALRCGTAVITADHPVFTGNEYRPALSAQGMPGVWLSEGTGGTYVQSMLFTQEGAGAGGAGLRLLPGQVQPAGGRAPEVSESSRGGRTHVLLEGLLRRVQAGASRPVQYLARALRRMREAAGWQKADQVLLASMLHSTQGGAPGDGELRSGMAGHKIADLPAGQSLPPVRGPQGTDGGAPRGPQPGEQRTDELGAGVHAVPQEISRIHGTCAEDVAGLLPTADYVVDFQTGTGNFFTGGLLVHNCLIIDDPVKNAEEADSADTREKVWEWYNSTAYTRLAPGAGVLLIMTWWHDDDLAGRIQNLMRVGHDDEHVDQFEVIKYPAIATSDEYYDNETHLIVDEPPESGRLLRKQGEPLHADRYDLDKLLRIKAQNQGGRWWSALYQQNPVPDDGAYFLKEQFRRAALPHLSRSNCYIAWDFAISEKKQNDYTVGTVILQDENDVLHVAEQLRFKSGDALFIIEAILNLSKKWYTSGQQLGFEDGQIYRAIEALLKKRMRERLEYPSITVLKPITDKMARARPLQGRMQQGMVSFNSDAGNDWYEPCRMEMLRFPAGVHDDCVDSLSWGVQMAIGRQPPRGPTPTRPQKSWRDRLNNTSSGSYMSA